MESKEIQGLHFLSNDTTTILSNQRITRIKIKIIERKDINIKPFCEKQQKSANLNRSPPKTVNALQEL